MKKLNLFGALAVAAVAIAAISCTEQKQEPQGLVIEKQGTTYNAYINNLRIKHFISLYNEAAATHQPTTIQQLAYQSGFRSYGTFNTAFKQSMGMTATKWMRIQYR